MVKIIQNSMQCSEQSDEFQIWNPQLFHNF